MMYFSEIKNCLNADNLDFRNVIEKVIDNFYDEIVTEQSQQILSVAFDDSLTQEKLDTFLASWDIEENTAQKAMLVAYAMKQHPNLVFSNAVLPRLNGLLKFHRFKNLQLISHFTKICKALNEKKIFPMILKGGAMKFIRQDLPRVMGDIDILIHQNEYSSACETARSLGYYFEEKKEMHAIDLHPSKDDESGILDIHRWIDFNVEYDHAFTDEFFKRAVLQKVFGADVYVPCAEDMVFMALVNMSKNLTRKTSMNGILYTLFDCKYLLQNKPDFDWDIVVANCKATNTELHMYFAINFVNRIVPGLLPASLFEEGSIIGVFEDYCYKLMYSRFYLEDIRTICRQIKIGQALVSPGLMLKYLQYKPKYVLLKSIRNNVWAIKKLINLRTK